MKEIGCLIQLASSTKVNHAIMVTTLQLKQPICFYSDIYTYVLLKVHALDECNVI